MVFPGKMGDLEDEGRKSQSPFWGPFSTSMLVGKRVSDLSLGEVFKFLEKNNIFDEDLPTDHLVTHNEVWRRSVEDSLER